MALNDQIWRDDLVDLQDDVKSNTKVLSDWVVRAHHQRAPPELVARLTQIRRTQAVLSAADVMDSLSTV
jgi:small-conductance mechanosensitive channel